MLIFTICNSFSTLLGILPCIKFIYSLGENLLDNVDSEKTLESISFSKLNWSKQCERLSSLVETKQLGMIKNKRIYLWKRRNLYI